MGGAYRPRKEGSPPFAFFVDFEGAGLTHCLHRTTFSGNVKSGRTVQLRRFSNLLAIGLSSSRFGKKIELTKSNFILSLLFFPQFLQLCFPLSFTFTFSPSTIRSFGS